MERRQKQKVIAFKWFDSGLGVGFRHRNYELFELAENRFSIIQKIQFNQDSWGRRRSFSLRVSRPYNFRLYKPEVKSDLEEATVVVVVYQCPETLVKVVVLYWYEVWSGHLANLRSKLRRYRTLLQNLARLTN